MLQLILKCLLEKIITKLHSCGYKYYVNTWYDILTFSVMNQGVGGEQLRLDFGDFSTWCLNCLPVVFW